MSSTSIDSGKVKHFWEARGERLGSVPFESIANLEEHPELLKLKVKLEQECILPLLPERRDVRLLDLGAGVGQWVFRFAPIVSQVVAVEYAESLAAIGRAETSRRGHDNVEWVVCAAEDYTSEEPFDVVFISGLFVYLTDEQCARLMSGVRRLLRQGGRLILRDGTSVLPSRHQITNRWSETLQAHYSAVYRRAEEYKALFADAGFSCQGEGNVFPDGCPLNKFGETRLRYYVFSPNP